MFHVIWMTLFEDWGYFKYLRSETVLVLMTKLNNCNNGAMKDPIKFFTKNEAATAANWHLNYFVVKMMSSSVIFEPASFSKF